MNKLIAIWLIGLSSIMLSSSAQAIRLEPIFIVSSAPQVMSYGSSTFYCYPNHLIVPTNNHYDQRTIRDMARLSRHLGWQHTYILSPRHQYGVPSKYSRLAQREFYRYGVNYSYYYPQERYSYQKPRSHYKQNNHFYRDDYQRRGKNRHNSSGITFRFSF